jgi:hypothetical protein
MEEPGALAEIVQHQTGFYIDPGYPDIASANMAQV